MAQKQDIFDLLGGRVRFRRGIYNPTADAVWLGAFAPRGKTVLDVGIGTGGVAMCYLSHHPMARVTGLDISVDMLAECSGNAKLNNRDIELINADILNWKTDKTFDIVMTNPPYFKGTPRKESVKRNQESVQGNQESVLHHNTNLTKWVQKCVARVRPRGYFCTIVDAATCANIICAIGDVCGDITIFPLFGAKNTAERVLIRGRVGVRTGTTLFNGMSMNTDMVLRDGLTIDAVLARLKDC